MSVFSGFKSLNIKGKIFTLFKVATKFSQEIFICPDRNPMKKKSSLTLKVNTNLPLDDNLNVAFRLNIDLKVNHWK